MADPIATVSPLQTAVLAVREQCASDNECAAKLGVSTPTYLKVRDGLPVRYGTRQTVEQALRELATLPTPPGAPPPVPLNQAFLEAIVTVSQAFTSAGQTMLAYAEGMGWKPPQPVLVTDPAPAAAATEVPPASETPPEGDVPYTPSFERRHHLPKRCAADGRAVVYSNRFQREFEALNEPTREMITHKLMGFGLGGIRRQRVAGPHGNRLRKTYGIKGLPLEAIRSADLRIFVTPDKHSRMYMFGGIVRRGDIPGYKEL